jgi:16S rRNA (cytidine1402-2'-O)-methyltransferase
MTSTQAKTSGTLFVVGTPIGNLGDLSPRARDVLSTVEIVAAEDTRRTSRLLSSIGAQPTIISYHDHNEATRVETVLSRLRSGTDVALVSDAGMPLISDPGWGLVHAALAETIPVRCVPGPSAVLAGLALSGLPAERFAFEGFLPRRAGQRAERLRSLSDEERTMVFFESVHRLRETLDALVECFGPEREAAVLREMTKVHEAVYSGSLADLAAGVEHAIPLLGEFVVVVAGNRDRGSAEEQEIRRVFELLRAEVDADSAVTLCAAITGASRNVVYRLTRVRG